MSTRKYGNPFLATLNRQRRLKKGFQIRFNDTDNNTFGLDNETSLFNERIAYSNYMKKVNPQRRDKAGRFLPISEGKDNGYS